MKQLALNDGFFKLQSVTGLGKLAYQSNSSRTSFLNRERPLA